MYITVKLSMQVEVEACILIFANRCINMHVRGSTTLCNGTAALLPVNGNSRVIGDC